MPTKKQAVKKTHRKAVSESLKIEGISFAKALKDTAVIKRLKQHGRAFSI